MERAQKESIESSGLLIEINPEGFCVRANNATLSETGYLPQEIIGKKFKSFLEIDPNYLREVEQKIATSSENVVHFECYFKHKTGHSIFMQWAIYWSENQNNVICIGNISGQNEWQKSSENQRLQLLNAFHENIQAATNEEDLFTEFCGIIIRLGHYPLAWIGQNVDGNITLLKKDCELFVSDHTFESSILGSDLFKNWNIKALTKPLNVLDLNEQQENEIAQTLKIPIKKILLVALPAKPGIFIGIGSTDLGKFDENTQQVFEKLSNRLGFALKSFENEGLLKDSEIKLKKNIRELNLLNEINYKIQHIKDETLLIKEVLKSLSEQGNYKLSWIAFFESDKEKEEIIVPSYSFGVNEYASLLKFDLNNSEILKGPTATCILTRKTAIVNYSLSDPNFLFWKEQAEVYGLQSLACLFLSISEKNKGVLAVYSGDVNAFDKHEILNLERIAQSLSYAIGSIRAYNESSLFKTELSQSQQKLLNYETALNETSIVSITDADGSITYVNKKFENTYGLSFGQVVGTKHVPLNSKFHTSEFWESLWLHINEGKIWIGKIKNIDFAGIERWFETIIYPFVANNGTPYQFMCMQRDISESIVLQEKTEMVNRLVDSAEVAIYSINTNIEVISWNNAASKVYGYSEAEMLGKKYSAILTEEQIEAMDIILKRVFAGISIPAIEVERISKDKKSVYLSLSISPIRNNNHEIIGSAIIAKDITRTKQAELMAFSLNTKLITREREFEFLYELSNLNNDKGGAISTYIADFIALMGKHWNNHILSNFKITYKEKDYTSKNFNSFETFTSCEFKLDSTNEAIIKVFHPADYYLSKSEKYILNLGSSWINAGLKSKEFSAKLSTRIKELNTLQYLAKLAEDFPSDIHKLFNKLVIFIPNGWQFPELVCVTLQYDNQLFYSHERSGLGLRIMAQFETIDKVKGSIEVSYKNKSDNLLEKPFLEEEQSLLNELAEKLRTIINQQILHTRLKNAENKIQKIANYVDASVVLLDPQYNIIFSNEQSIGMMKELFQINANRNQNMLSQLNETQHLDLSQAIKTLKELPDTKINFEIYKASNKINSYELRLNNIDPFNFDHSDKLIVIREISHLRDREEEINNLINLLKDLNFITSFEISHELHKLQSIVELAQDLEFEDADLKDIFSTSKETFLKTNTAIKKLINRINTPLQREISIANSLKRIEKVFLIDDDELSNKISLRILEKHFDSMKLCSYTSLDDAIAYLKSEPDNGNNLIIIDPNMKEKLGWEFFDFYYAKNMKSPVLLMGSNPDQLSTQRAMGFNCVKNFLQKPLNNETAAQIKNKDAFIWNN